MAIVIFSAICLFIFTLIVFYFYVTDEKERRRLVKKSQYNDLRMIQEDHDRLCENVFHK